LEESRRKGTDSDLDFRNVLNDETKRFAMLWIFLTLYEFLKQRGRSDVPFVVTIDEFAALTQQVTAGVNPLAVLLYEFINQYMRNNNIWLTVAQQAIYQVDEQLRNTLLSLGNYVFGRVATMEEARVLADALFANDVYRVKHYRNVWGKVDLPPTRYGRISSYDDNGYFVLDREPVYMDLTDQLELSAQKLHRLRLFEFLLRPATREGEVSQSVIPISIANFLRDTENDEFQFPDQALVAKLRSGLAARSGIPIATILKEQEQRLTSGTMQDRQGSAPLAADPADVADPCRIPAKVQPAPQNAGANPSHPTLNEQQKAFLAFLITNPDVPIAAVSKGLKIRAVTATEIRDTLKAHGFLQELDQNREDNCWQTNEISHSNVSSVGTIRERPTGRQGRCAPSPSAAHGARRLSCGI
jgi:hypothetical protein